MNIQTRGVIVAALLFLLNFTALANLEVRVSGTLHKQDLITIPGLSPPALYSVSSDDQTSYGLDFSQHPDLEAVAESNRSKTITVEGELYWHATETPTGEQLEWPMILVRVISVQSN